MILVTLPAPHNTAEKNSTNSQIKDGISIGQRTMQPQVMLLKPQISLLPRYAGSLCSVFRSRLLRSWLRHRILHHWFGLWGHCRTLAEEAERCQRFCRVGQLTLFFFESIGLLLYTLVGN